MLHRSEMLQACRRVDAAIAAGVPLDAILSDHDVDPRSATAIAESRALRVALIYDGWSESEVNAMAEQLRPGRCRMSEAVQFWMPALAAVYLDGFTTRTVINRTPDGLFLVQR